MTTQNAIKIAKNRIKFHVEFLEEIDRIEREDQGVTEISLFTKMLLIIKTLVNRENETLEQILAELKHDSKGAKKSL